MVKVQMRTDFNLRASSANMAKNKQPLKVDQEEGLQETNANSNEPKPISDQENEPINETGSGGVNFPLVNVVSALDTPGSCSQIPFLWPSSVNYKYRCIYRVPCRLRIVNPEAYTPYMLLIGPLYHSKKAIAEELSKTDSRYLDYMKMERHKKKYLENVKLTYGNQSVEEFITIIKRDEQIIRACYAESTDYINSQDFVEMMLLDSVFMLVFFLQFGLRYINITGDFIFDAPCHQYTILEDLILLENQLPYFLLENLFDPFFKMRGKDVTFREIILECFGFKDKIKREVKFLHFTDLSRRVRVETLGLTEEAQVKAKLERKKMITSLHNADELDSAGVKFVGCKEENVDSLVIEFDRGILKMPCFIAQDNTEKVLRNMMALEQCHYPYTAYVCNYISFLDFLIDTEQDVELLVDQGVIKNWLGRHGSVAEMVNKLCSEIVDCGSQYYDIAERLNKHYENRLNRSVSTLRRVYFKDLWTGTATVAAVVILVLTLIGTVASVLQVTQKDNNPTKSLPPPPPSQKP